MQDIQSKDGFKNTDFEEHLQRLLLKFNYLALVNVAYEFSPNILSNDTFEAFGTSKNSALKLLLYFFPHDIAL